MATKSAVLPAQDDLLSKTLGGFRLATESARLSADLVLGAKTLSQVSACERELDELDREIDARVAAEVVNATPEQVREKLACLKCMIDLERIGDLLLSFATRADAVRARMEMQDLAELGKMASLLAKMLEDTQRAFVARNAQAALDVVKADSEVDRLRNLVVMRHLEPDSPAVGPASVHVVTMAQALERAADHTKNVAEEIAHLVTGRTLRHLRRLQEKSDEQLYLEHLKRQHRA